MRKLLTLPTILVIMLAALASCRSTQKASQARTYSRDSLEKTRIDSTNVSRVDTLSEKETEILFSTNKTDSARDGVIVTLDPRDTARRILVEIDTDPEKPEDYLNPEKPKKKRFTITVPTGTRTVEIYTKEHKERSDSLQIRTKDSTAVHKLDSGTVTRDKEILVSEEESTKSRTVKKTGLACGGGILLILLLIGGGAWFYRRWRRAQLIK